jgi:antitoxin component of MazEF toxin-antitoxin module
MEEAESRYLEVKGVTYMTVLDAPIGKSTLGKWGNSVGVRIPSEVLKIAQLTEGVELEFYLTTEGEILLRPKLVEELTEQERLRALYLQLTAQVNPEAEGHNEDWEPLGDEVFE